MKRYRVSVYLKGKDTDTITGTGIGIERYDGQKIQEIMSLYFPERMSLTAAYILAISLIAEESKGEQVFIKVFHGNGVEKVLTRQCKHDNVVKIRNMRRKLEPTVTALARDAVYRQTSIREILN